MRRLVGMMKRARSRAERHFTATQKKDEQFLKEKEKAQQETKKHVASLRALRLAKEAADKEAAAAADAEDGAAKNEERSR
jgi:hypothetical protein